MKSFTPLNVQREGRLRFADREINVSNVANIHVSFCTSLLSHGGCMPNIAFILARFASIPLCDTR
jgi:hypothetical protein